MTKLVKADINGLRSSSTTKTFKEINDFDVVKWLSDRPPELLQFLSKLCNIEINTESPKKLNIIAKITKNPSTTVLIQGSSYRITCLKIYYATL